MTSAQEHESPGSAGSRPGMPILAVLFLLGLLGSSGGCAALTNPVADATPVRLLPPELLTPSKDAEQTILLPLLGQPHPPAYLLGPGDVLGVYVESILGNANQPLPLQVAPLVEAAGQRRLPPAVGYPVPVHADGTISLRLLEPLCVKGMTLEQVEETVRKLYTSKDILKSDKQQVIVTLLHPRHYQVVVLRQESGNITLGPGGQIGGAKRGTGHAIDLPAYENDVLHALTESGGLPGLDAYDEVIVERGCFEDEQGRSAFLRSLEASPAGPLGAPIPSRQTIHIPLRWPPCQDVPFRPEDVVLHTGDVVFLEARDRDLFYTGGLLPPGEHLLPRDRDLDVLEALTQVMGPLVNGAFAISNLSGNLIAPGIGGPSPSLLVVVRRTPGGGQVSIRVDLNRALRDPRERLLVRPGDLLLLQEKPGEALARYFDQTFLNFDVFWDVIHTKHASGVLDIAAPDRLPNRVGLINETKPQ